jgi:hypothetical protein
MIIDVPTAKTFCQIGHAEEDPIIEILIESAEEWVQRYTGTRFYTGSDDTPPAEYCNGGAESLWPIFHPINDVTQIQDRENSENYDLTATRFDTWSIWLADGGEWGAGRQRWQVTYKAGYTIDTIPAGLKLEILNMIKRAYDNRGGLKADSISGLRTDWEALLDSDMIKRISLFSFRQDFF